MKSFRACLAAAAVIITSPVTLTHADDPPLVNEDPNNCGISISADKNWLSVNDNDDNNDEQWDFNTEPVVGEKDTLKITVTGTADKNDATVTVSIETGSDKIDGFWEGTLTVSGQASTGTELDGQEKRSDKKTTFTVPKGGSATQTLYIEGIKHSASLRDVKINARIEAPAGTTPDPDNRPFSASSLDATPLEITVYQVDLDVDSNNDNAFDFEGFDDAEDEIEASEKEDANGSMRPGKIVISSSQTNSDGDDVPDFADGFNLQFTGTVNELEHVSETLKFVPVQVELKEPFDTASAKVKFTYGTISQPGPVSKPELSEEGIGVTGAGTPEDPYVFNLNKGGIRLWKKKATERTSGEAVPSGDFVPADTEINWSDIATDISTPRKAKLYLEYVDMTPAEAAGRKNIAVTATQEDVKSEDKVIVTLPLVDLDVNGNGNLTDSCDGLATYLPGYNRDQTNQTMLHTGSSFKDVQYAGPQEMQLIITGLGINVVDSATFKILNSTSYFGYCGNAIAKGGSSAAEAINSGADFSFEDAGDDLEIEGTIEPGRIWAPIFCKDYGAWCEVEITLKKNGVAIGNPIKLTLPLDDNGDKIADCWQDQQNAEWNDQFNHTTPRPITPASRALVQPDLDNEEIDSDGNNGVGRDLPAMAVPGDGLKIREEYRGYILDGGPNLVHSGDHKRLSIARKELLVECSVEEDLTIENKNGEGTNQTVLSGFTVASAMADVSSFYRDEQKGAEEDFFLLIC